MSSRIDLVAKALEDAERTGTASVAVDGRTYCLSETNHREAGETSHFDGAEAIMSPPLRRLAYSDRTAWLMAALSDLVYRKFEGDAEIKDAEQREAKRLEVMRQLQAELRDAGMDLLETFLCVTTDTQAILVRRPGEFRALVFRGTENLTDAKTDADAFFSPTDFGRTHHGFQKAWDSVATMIDAALDETEAKGMDEQLIISGHSLGGALATVATRFLEGDRTLSACYTFGSPRVGDEVFADSFKTPVYRVVNRADLVPTVPGSGMLRWIVDALTRLPVLAWAAKPAAKFMDMGFVGFQHVGDLRLLTGNESSAALKIGTAAALTRAKVMLVDNWSRPKVWFGLKTVVEDHGMAHYVAKLRTIAQRRNKP